MAEAPRRRSARKLSFGIYILQINPARFLQGLSCAPPAASTLSTFKLLLLRAVKNKYSCVFTAQGRIQSPQQYKLLGLKFQVD